MATLAPSRPSLIRGQGFWFYSALAMALTNVAGFSLQMAMGRSSFGAPPIVHSHAIVFFTWVFIYLAQNTFAATGNMALHRRLGWIAAGWMVLMVVMGTAVTVALTRAGRVPFFFTPGYFLVMNPLSVLVFAGLGAAAIAMRRQTQWHRRLHYCGMTMIMGPAMGRLLPAPLMIPYASWGIFAGVLLFPLAGVLHDLRRGGRVHPAWWVGIAVLVATQVSTGLIADSPIGRSLYAAVTAGSPGAAIAPLSYPKPPWMP